MSNVMNHSLYSTSQIASGEHIVGLVLAMSVIFLIVIVCVSAKVYKIGKKSGQKDAKEELQEHVLRSQIMRELGMAAPAKQADTAGAKPVVVDVSAAAAPAQSLPTLPPLPVMPVVAAVEEVVEPPKSDDQLIADLERELAAA